jgi:hypothetical protein
MEELRRMARESSQFGVLLEQEFQRIRDLKGDDLWARTSRGMAGVLKIPPSTISHYRAGTRFPNEDNVQEIAKILRSEENGGDEASRRALVDALLAARPTRSDSQLEAQTWLRNVGKETHLLLVEFRDFPSASPNNPSREVAKEMAQEAGKAVAKGLSYALLNPFTPAYQKSVSELTELTNYLNSLCRAIRDTYKRILEEAYHQVILDHPDNVTRQEEEFGEIKKRLRMYRWAEPPSQQNDSPDCCAGIGYKLLYHVEGSETPELWHWLSPPHGETVIRKPHYMPEILAVEEGFYPILQMFGETGQFPTTSEMEAYAKRESRRSLWEETNESTDSRVDSIAREKAKARGKKSEG